MSVKRITDSESQLWTDTTLDTLTKSDNLEAQLKFFLISCKVNNLSAKSIRFYEQVIRPFISFCRERDITTPKEITANVIRIYILALQQRIKPVSVRDHYRGIKRFLNWLVEEGILGESPMARLRPPRVPKQIVQPFTKDQINRMLVVCNNSFAGCRDKAVIFTFVDTGLRLSELANIQLSDVNIDTGIIKVTGKGAKQRLVHISTETQKAVLTYIARRTDNFPCLWVTEERRPITAEGIRQIVRRIGKRAGITGVRCSPHTFRHTFGILALRCGIGEFGLQHLLGHESLYTTRRYTESLNDEDAIKAHMKASPVDHLKLRARERG